MHTILDPDPTQTRVHTHTHIYIYIYIYICVCLHIFRNILRKYSQFLVHFCMNIFIVTVCYIFTQKYMILILSTHKMKSFSRALYLIVASCVQIAPKALNKTFCFFFHSHQSFGRLGFLILIELTVQAKGNPDFFRLYQYISF